MTKTKPISVLMVCLGNICRSPMAEAAFRDLVSREKLSIIVDSAAGLLKKIRKDTAIAANISRP